MVYQAGSDQLVGTRYEVVFMYARRISLLSPLTSHQRGATSGSHWAQQCALHADAGADSLLGGCVVRHQMRTTQQTDRLVRRDAGVAPSPEGYCVLEGYSGGLLSTARRYSIVSTLQCMGPSIQVAGGGYYGV
jgi:hypothetical protein